MKTLDVLIDNYKSTTEGLSLFGKVIVTFVVALIIISVISAFINLALSI